MKTFGLAVLAALGSYLVGLFGGMLLIEVVSSNVHDRSMEGAMTGAFAIVPLTAVLAVIVVVAIRLRSVS